MFRKKKKAKNKPKKHNLSNTLLQKNPMREMESLIIG